jgi:hypothetical protein
MESPSNRTLLMTPTRGLHPIGVSVGVLFNMHNLDNCYPSRPLLTVLG